MTIVHINSGENAAEIILTGNEIHPEQSLSAGIWINGGNGITEISDNIITGSNDVRLGYGFPKHLLLIIQLLELAHPA
jgi:hypothetical protein